VVTIPYTYPPVAPTISGDFETISRFLNSPTNVARRLRTLAEQRFIGDVLLSSRVPAEGGAIVYEQNEGLYTDRVIEQVSPGSEYPVTTVASGPAQVAKVVKWGQDTYIYDEAIRRLGFSPVDRGLLKLVNTLVKQVDSVCLSLIASSVTQTQAASAAWSASTATILRDVLKAQATINTLNQGYNPDTLIVDDLTYAYLASDPTILTSARREDSGSAVYSGEFPVVGGLQVLATPNLPAAGAWVLDSTMLGGIAEEALGGGYAQVGNGVESKAIRDDEVDGWRLRVRRVFVPYVMEPNAAVKITGI
jgi:hypothetical protein